MSKLDTKIINQKLEEVFNKLDSAANINIALGFVFQNIVNIDISTPMKLMLYLKNPICSVLKQT